jgi:small subunit ribosomal protein S13
VRTRDINSAKDKIMRVVGVNIPDEKRVDIALTYIYGIGRSNVLPVLETADVDGTKRVKDLTEDEVKRITRALDTYKVEGDLRAEIASNVRRLKDTGSYRGIRHARGLPARGQRTRSNARTKRGKRVTIGAIKKEVMAKMEAAQKAKGK